MPILIQEKSLKIREMKCEVKYFGMISEKLGLTTEMIETEAVLSDVKDLQKSFMQRFPELINMTFQIAVNGHISNELSGKDIKTIALLPPFAGG